MYKDLQSSTLLIISDTSISVKDSKSYGFEPVVKELEYFLKIFDKVEWIGFRDEKLFDYKAFKQIDSKRVELKFLPKVGGKKISDKLNVIHSYFNSSKLIFNILKKHKYIHVRGPSHPSIIALFYSLVYFKSEKKMWFKYAGSWIDKAPFFYDLQRKLLKLIPVKNNIVTINGGYESHRVNFLNFQNPCLTHEDRIASKQISKNERNYFVFVGNLNPAKGVDLLINYFKKSTHEIYFVGGGEKYKYYKEKFANYRNIHFVGQKSKSEVIKYLKLSKALILPSKSEGFPKVVSEAMNFGCIPIVSDVSCISEIINHKINGYMLEKLNESSIDNAIIWLENLSINSKENIIHKNIESAKIFTYRYYVSRIIKEIF